MAGPTSGWSPIRAVIFVLDGYFLSSIHTCKPNAFLLNPLFIYIHSYLTCLGALLTCTQTHLFDTVPYGTHGTLDHTQEGLEQLWVSCNFTLPVPYIAANSILRYHSSPPSAQPLSSHCRLTIPARDTTPVPQGPVWQPDCLLEETLLVVCI